VELLVTDTGVGMDAETQSRMFEPFFTTKEIGKGTGLGLATVFGIVKRSGGAISVASKRGEGTTFRVRFPHTDHPTSGPLAGSRSLTPEPRSTGARTIVIVEDDAAVRRGLERILRKAGYSVTAWASPSEALRHIQRELANVHLLVTDIVMPDMRGTDLARSVTALSSTTKVLFVSGYANLKSDEILEHPLLRKPFQVERLLGQVEMLLRS
jgi:CheY-like chemotaxis protein